MGVNQHRARVVYGRVMTKARFTLVESYTRRRMAALPDLMAVSTQHWLAYQEWVNGFRKFMCRGLSSEARVERGGSVPHEAPDIQRDKVADASAHDPATARVD